MKTRSILAARRVTRTALAMATVALACSGCQVDREPNYEFLPWINYMFFPTGAESQGKAPVNAKTGKPVFANGMVMQKPPVGTVPHVKDREFYPLHFGADDAGRKAAEGLKNPFDATAAHLTRGQWGFETFCAPCHNTNGDGAGTVSKKAGWSFPLATKESKVNGFSDGTIFHIVSYGRGAMPAYASQISQEDRWKIILHLRELQKQNK